MRRNRNVVAGLALALLSLGLAGCPAPGEGAKAEAGYRGAEPIIAALERIKQEQGRYPDTLAALPPASDGTPADRGFKYVSHGDRFELTFSYTGPGVNHCTYDSAITTGKRWRCHGYY